MSGEEPGRKLSPIQLPNRPDARSPERAGASRCCGDRRSARVSRQRASELSSQRRDSPGLVAKLAAGPVWLESALRRFVENWSREPTSIDAESLNTRHAP